MPYYFETRHHDTFIFCAVDMDAALARDQALASCRALIPEQSPLNAEAMSLNKEYQDFSSFGHAVTRLRSQQNKAFFFITVRPTDESGSEADFAAFLAAFDRYFCRQIHITDFGDNFTIAQSIYLGSPSPVPTASRMAFPT